MTKTEQRGNAAVSWLKSPKHAYEDRYRLLTGDIPAVGQSGRGELFGVLDGIGSAPMGMAAAQAMADCLADFFRRKDVYTADWQGLYNLLHKTNVAIFDWGFMEGSDRPLGGCAGTVAWLHDGQISMFHAGDTVGMLIREGKEPRLLTRLHETHGDIYRYFGLGVTLEIDVGTCPVEEGDLILLLSDGVTKAYSTTEAANLVREIYDRTGDIAAAAEELVTRSRSKKSSDDITALVIEIVLECEPSGEI